MVIYELIEKLRRFPLTSSVDVRGQLMIDITPFEKDGNIVFDALCDDRDLPEELQ